MARLAEGIALQAWPHNRSLSRWEKADKTAFPDLVGIRMDSFKIGQIDVRGE